MLVLAAACGHPVRPQPPPAWEVVTPTGAPIGLYSYREPLAAYAPDDRGAYVIHVAGDPAARAAAVAGVPVTDDVVGDDGYVVRLDAVDAAALAARPGVIAVTPLAPADRRGVLVDRATELPEVRIDLFADATPDEVSAVAAWVTWRGGQVLWKGKAALRARLPLDARDDASRLSVVRWIE